ncbi:hypothetical protein [Clostridium cibarium]|uniref:Adhesin domain-containing protein n=1 Tax=Clostridium cibarium TaxID=2762247 RepID=A0ABR8PT86_9CLOT|nr:hypothetical protein [Clostridium cibarium]MBD7911386.1 hypothetical protein [Clostridium cibarium]
MKHRAIIGVIVSISTIFFISCSKNSINSFNKTDSYTKEDCAEYTYKVNGDNLIVDNTCSALKITKSDSDEIKISMKKSVGGSKEELLQEALDNIKCTFKDNTLKIGPEKGDESLITSKNIEATISIPNAITTLDMESKVGDIDLEGDYDRLKLDEKVGNLLYKGDLKQGSIISDVGEVELNLKSLDSSNKYDIKSNVGEVKIVVPKKSTINLTGPSAKNVKLPEDIISSSDGATFEIDSKVSNTRMED